MQSPAGYRDKTRSGHSRTHRAEGGQGQRGPRLQVRGEVPDARKDRRPCGPRPEGPLAEPGGKERKAAKSKSVTVLSESHKAEVGAANNTPGKGAISHGSTSGAFRPPPTNWDRARQRRTIVVRPCPKRPPPPTPASAGATPPRRRLYRHQTPPAASDAGGSPRPPRVVSTTTPSPTRRRNPRSDAAQNPQPSSAAWHRPAKRPEPGVRTWGATTRLRGCPTYVSYVPHSFKFIRCR